MMGFDYGKSDIVQALYGNADWRSEVAERYPNDRRNREAVKSSNRLADAVNKLRGSNILFRDIEHICDAVEDDNESCKLIEAANCFFKDIGFNSDYSDAEHLLTALYDDLRSVVEWEWDPEPEPEPAPAVRKRRRPVDPKEWRGRFSLHLVGDDA